MVSSWYVLILNLEGLVTLTSPNVEQLAGCAPSELYGRPVTAVLADRSAFEIPRILESARLRGRWEGEIVHRSRNGDEARLRGMVISVIGADKQIAGFSLITTLKESKEAGGESVLEDGARLRTLLHELNNPLAAVMGFSQLVMMDKSCEGALRSYMEKLFAEVLRMTEIVEELRSYAISLQQK